MRMILLAITTISVLASCTSTDRQKIRGSYVWGHETETFTPCGSSQSLWVVGDVALLQPLRDIAAEQSQFKGQPYLPIYLEVAGTIEPQASDGFAADYDGVLRITHVYASQSSLPNHCGRHG